VAGAILALQPKVAMEEETADEPEKSLPGKPSQTLSWATLGFVVGALFILTLPSRRAAAPVAPRPAEPTRPVVLAPLQLTTIEAVFTEWGHFAVWEGDFTEVALWNTQTNSYADCYEVLRSGGGTYFRSIPRLTRVVLTHGVPPNAPLEFTETAAQRAEWLGQKTAEDWKTLGNAGIAGHP
jgi:hypothetical protein